MPSMDMALDSWSMARAAVVLLLLELAQLGHAQQLCDDSCRRATNGRCDGPPICATGTDCTDCGGNVVVQEPAPPPAPPPQWPPPPPPPPPSTQPHRSGSPPPPAPGSTVATAGSDGVSALLAQYDDDQSGALESAELADLVRDGGSNGAGGAAAYPSTPSTRLPGSTVGFVQTPGGYPTGPSATAEAWITDFSTHPLPVGFTLLWVAILAVMLAQAARKTSQSATTQGDDAAAEQLPALSSADAKLALILTAGAKSCFFIQAPGFGFLVFPLKTERDCGPQALFW